MSDSPRSADSANDFEDDVETLNERKVVAKAAESVDNHTPVVSHPDEHITDPSSDNDRLTTIESTLESLGTAVKILTDFVGDAVKDESPRGPAVPWTHFGSKPHD